MWSTRICRHYIGSGQLSGSGSEWALGTRRWDSIRIKAAPYPVVTVHFSPPDSPAPSYLILPMDTVKGFLGPLGLNTSSIQDTLVCVFYTCTPLNRLSHDSQKLVVIGGTVETARRASISAWNGFVDCSSLP